MPLEWARCAVSRRVLPLHGARSGFLRASRKLILKGVDGASLSPTRRKSAWMPTSNRFTIGREFAHKGYELMNCLTFATQQAGLAQCRTRADMAPNCTVKTNPSWRPSPPRRRRFRYPQGRRQARAHELRKADAESSARSSKPARLIRQWKSTTNRRRDSCVSKARL